MNGLGGTMIETGSDSSYWSSTQSTAYNAWYCKFNPRGSHNSTYKNGVLRVRAFCAF